MRPPCNWRHDAWAQFCCWCGGYIHNPMHRSRLILKEGQDPHVCCPACLGKALDYPTNWQQLKRLVEA